MKSWKKILNVTGWIIAFGFSGLVVNSALAEVEWDPEAVISTNTCAECHEDAVDVWKESKHFASYRNFHKTKEAKEIALELGMDPKKIKRADSLCADCHYTKGVKNNRVKPIAGISCQSCHGAAKDWVELHNDYGGPSIKASTESPAHKQQRFADMHAAGMVYPANLYGLANNCFQCHLIANPDLINNTSHPTSSDFDLVDRSQSDIRHYQAADSSKKSKLAIAGLTAQMVQSLKALATATPGDRFSDEMTATAQTASANLIRLSKQLDDPNLQVLASQLQNINIRAGDKSLLKTSAAIAEQAVALVGVEGSVSQRKTLAVIDVKPKPKVARKVDVKKVKEGIKPKLKSKPKNTKHASVESQQSVKQHTQAVSQFVGSSSVQRQLINRFDVIQPLSPVMCFSRAPWLKGRYPLKLDQFTADQTCFGLEVQKSERTKLIILASAEDKVVRLFPNQCRFFGGASDGFNGSSRAMLPVNANGQLVAAKLGFKPKSMVAVVIDSNAESAWDKLLQQTVDICRESDAGLVNLEALLSELNLTSNNGLQWQWYR